MTSGKGTSSIHLRFCFCRGFCLPPREREREIERERERDREREREREREMLTKPSFGVALCLPCISQHASLGLHCPRKMFNLTRKNGLKDAKKRSEKRSETRPNNFKPLSGRLKIFHQHFSKSSSLPKICEKMFLFIAKLCRGGHAHASYTWSESNLHGVLLECFCQGAPEGRQQKGETGPGTHIFADFCRFSLILGSLCKSRDLGVAENRRKPQETADFRRKPQKTADFCRNRFLPFAVSLLARSYFVHLAGSAPKSAFWVLCLAFFSPKNANKSAFLGVRQRSGEGVVRRNGCPKGCFWRVRFFSAPLRFVLTKTPARSWKPYGGRVETDSPKTPLWTTVSLHDAFAAPLAHSQKSTLWGTPSQVPTHTQKALRGALSEARAPGLSCKWRPGSQNKIKKIRCANCQSSAFGFLYFRGRFPQGAKFFPWQGYSLEKGAGELQEVWCLLIRF